MSERVAVFIDGRNLYHGLRKVLSIYDNDVDFRKLAEALSLGRLLIGCYYYNASLNISYDKTRYWKQQKLFDILRLTPGFRVMLCPTRKTIRPDGHVEYTVKGDDIWLATDMLSLAYENQYDEAIIVSGDADFVPAIRQVRKIGKTATNAYFMSRGSNALKSSCDRWLALDNIVKQCRNIG